MPEFQLSLALPQLLPLDDQAADPAPLEVTFQPLDERGEPVADPVEAKVKQRFVEGRGENGGFAWGPTVPRISAAAELPEGVRYLRVATPAGSTDYPLGDVSDPDARRPDQHRSFPSPGQHWTLAVVSERFDNAENFFTRAESLHDFISGQAPFSDPAVSFGVEALFWSSDVRQGLFGATDTNLAGRVLDGENKRVLRFVEKAAVPFRKILVIVNSGHRAGAGGQGRNVPSWTTISAPLHEPWQAIALHELGHAFGLADEYDTAYNLAEPDPLEPNVTRESDPARTSWRHFATVSAPPAPTALRDAEDAHAASTVGTFQGARYRETDRFRPSPNCRMRITTKSFCKVCSEHIRTELVS